MFYQNNHKRIFRAIIFALIPFCAKGQSIIWEKAIPFGYNISAQLYTICQTNDGNFLAGGKSSEFGIVVPGNSGFQGTAIIKFTPEGDSLWIKKLPILGTVKALHPTGTGFTWAVIDAVQPFLPGNNFYFPRAILLQNDSTPLLNVSFPQLDYFEISDSYPTIDGGLIIFGSKDPSVNPNLQKDFYAFKINAFGQEVWSRAYPLGVAGFGTAGQIEPMANGRFFCSGSDGKRLVSFEIFEEDGRDTLFRTWYNSPGNKVLLDPAGKQSINATVVWSASYFNTSTTVKSYFAKHDFLSNAIYWGGERAGGSGKLFTNIDGSILVQNSPITGELRYSKFDSDSNLIWFITGDNINGQKQIRDMLYLGNDTGIVVGSKYNQTNPTGPFFYIGKFSGVGYPYDPLGIKQPHLVKKDAFPFPNPTSGLFRFKKEYQKGEVHFFALNGRHMKSETLVAKGVIDISRFPAGTYFYRAILDGKPHTGKIVKE